MEIHLNMIISAIVLRLIGLANTAKFQPNVHQILAMDVASVKVEKHRTPIIFVLARSHGVVKTARKFLSKKWNPCYAPALMMTAMANQTSFLQKKTGKKPQTVGSLNERCITLLSILMNSFTCIYFRCHMW